MARKWYEFINLFLNSEWNARFGTLWNRIWGEEYNKEGVRIFAKRAESGGLLIVGGVNV